MKNQAGIIARRKRGQPFMPTGRGYALFPVFVVSVLLLLLLLPDMRQHKERIHMARIYLSPSTQEYNPYVIGGTDEETVMNNLADALVPYLDELGIAYDRNTPQMTARTSIQQANASGPYDLYLALHSNAAPEQFAGMLRGPDIYYNPADPESRRAAGLIADEFRRIYPDPALVDIRPATNLGEVLRPDYPSVLVEVAYHDNPEDAMWILQNYDAIARALTNAVQNFTGGTGKSLAYDA